jgi:hypothetical protein
MGKYYGGSGSAAAPINGPGCGDLTSGHINDIVGKACWLVTGRAIIIGGRAFSVQAGFEMCNLNFKVDSTSPPVPTLANLPGPSSRGVG